MGGSASLHCSISSSLETIVVACMFCCTREQGCCQLMRRPPSSLHGAQARTGGGVPYTTTRERQSRERHRYCCTWREACTRPGDTIRGLTRRKGEYYHCTGKFPTRPKDRSHVGSQPRPRRGRSKALFPTITHHHRWPNIVRCTLYFLQSCRL